MSRRSYESNPSGVEGRGFNPAAMALRLSGVLTPEAQIHRNSNNENAIRNRRNFMKTLTGGWF
jgi:hypothetical protein